MRWVLIIFLLISVIPSAQTQLLSQLWVDRASTYIDWLFGFHTSRVCCGGCVCSHARVSSVLNSLRNKGIDLVIVHAVFGSQLTNNVFQRSGQITHAGRCLWSTDWLIVVLC